MLLCFSLWFLSKLLVFVAFLIFDGTLISFEEMHLGNKRDNETSCLDTQLVFFKSKNDAFTILCIIYLMLSCTLGIAIDIYEIALNFKSWTRNHTSAYCHTPKGKKKLLYNYAAHRFKQLFVHVIMLMSVSFRILRFMFQFESSAFFSGLIHFMIVSHMGMILVFFLQIMPKVSFYAVILQRMTSTFMLHFSCIFTVVAFPYIIAIHRLVNFSQPNCQENFTTGYHTIYSVFLLTFNMVDFTNIEGSDDHLIILYVVHIVFVLLIGVLLINFLIALFTNYVGRVVEFRHIIVPVHMMAILGVVDTRLERHCKPALRHLEVKRFVTDSGGRVYIHRTLVVDPNGNGLKRRIWNENDLKPIWSDDTCFW